MATVSLPPGSWQRPGLAELAKLLDAQTGATRLVGGAVRDLLAGQDAKDIDLATRLTPDQVVARLGKAGIKVIPTGIAHGTVTAVIEAGPVEVTTLRRDVSTDGRRATIAFSDDWREDAARRDFTINALSADLLIGEVYDYFGGVGDLRAGRVCFIGDPLTRIAEDHLRILRFFRFQARFGTGTADADALAACAARANDLMALSRERVADELTKLLGLTDPLVGAGPLLDLRILDSVVPEVVGDARALLTQLVARERAGGHAASALRRLSAILPAVPETVSAIAVRLKFSNAARKHLVALAGRRDQDALAPRALAYWSGREAARDRLLLGGFETARLTGWEPPCFPLSGGALVERGIARGPDVARLLKQIEAQWVDADFPDAAQLEAMADACVAAQTPKER